MTPTLVTFLPVDVQGKEIDLPDGGVLPHGHVVHVPAVGDTVDLDRPGWVVVRRIWATPIPQTGAVRPGQVCVLHVRRPHELDYDLYGAVVQLVYASTGKWSGSAIEPVGPQVERAVRAIQAMHADLDENYGQDSDPL